MAEFSAELMVSNEKYAVQKLSGAEHLNFPVAGRFILVTDWRVVWTVTH